MSNINILLPTDAQENCFKRNIKINLVVWLQPHHQVNNTNVF